MPHPHTHVHQQRRTEKGRVWRRMEAAHLGSLPLQAHLGPTVPVPPFPGPLYLCCYSITVCDLHTHLGEAPEGRNYDPFLHHFISSFWLELFAGWTVAACMEDAWRVGQDGCQGWVNH